MNKRYEALDILRGLTLAFMCIVNNPGNWSAAFPMLHHASWSGFTPTDLVYPTFIFCSGCAMAFSFAKLSGANWAAYKKVIKRGVLIFLVGLLLNAFPFYPTNGGSWSEWFGHLRIFGVLQRIGLAYMLAGVIALALRDSRKISLAFVGLLVLHTALLLICSPSGQAFALEGNFSRKLDIFLIGENHLYGGYGVPFDPEGLLGTISAAGTALLGYLCGRMVIDSTDRTLSSAKISAFGVAGIVSGLLLSSLIPINKPLWTASYVLFAGGFSMILLGGIAYCTDVIGKSAGFGAFKIMGTNSLTGYALSQILAKLMWVCGIAIPAVFTLNSWTSLGWSILFAGVIFLFQWLLYRKKIIIKL